MNEAPWEITEKTSGAWYVQEEGTLRVDDEVLICEVADQGAGYVPCRCVGAGARLRSWVVAGMGGTEMNEKKWGAGRYETRDKQLDCVPGVEHDYRRRY